ARAHAVRRCFGPRGVAGAVFGRGLGAEARARQAPGAGRLVQRPGSDTPRGRGDALAQAAGAGRRDPEPDLRGRRAPSPGHGGGAAAPPELEDDAAGWRVGGRTRRAVCGAPRARPPASMGAETGARADLRRPFLLRIAPGRAVL